MIITEQSDHTTRHEDYTEQPGGTTQEKYYTQQSGHTTRHEDPAGIDRHLYIIL